MNMSLTIEGFHALLSSGEGSSSLLTALRTLTTIEKPENITVLAEDASQDWSNWSAL